MLMLVLRPCRTLGGLLIRLVRMRMPLPPTLALCPWPAVAVPVRLMAVRILETAAWLSTSQLLSSSDPLPDAFSLSLGVASDELDPDTTCSCERISW